MDTLLFMAQVVDSLQSTDYMLVLRLVKANTPDKTAVLLGPRSF